MSLEGNGAVAPNELTVPVATSDDPRAADMKAEEHLEVARNVIYLLVKHAGGSVRIPPRVIEDYFADLEGHQLKQYRSPINDDWVCELVKLTPVTQS